MKAENDANHTYIDINIRHNVSCVILCDLRFNTHVVSFWLSYRDFHLFSGVYLRHLAVMGFGRFVKENRYPLDRTRGEARTAKSSRHEDSR